MIGRNQDKEAARSIFMSSAKGLANVAALAAAFLLTPQFHAWTIPWVTEFTAQNYGEGWADTFWYLWWGICAAGIFFLTRATLATAILFGALAIATRLF
ncbi:hypothetical protein [Citromicrobium bathyomarinum]|uniref:hypothetical protein n=1 Tax=Citromicrobium bathyomarinum TaxID=72174 RepID=UPI001E558325|nr:hypothetical protein [Citromicrobium bathyomarinum]MCD1624328.1 hypothetical protein [Citromicrobium bathyomarinum]